MNMYPTGRKIIVVEDNRQNMKLVKDILTPHGYVVMGFQTAEEGIEAAKDGADLILMDIQLPGMDGLQAVGILKSSPVTAGIPAVALTSYAMKGDEERILESGYDGYISKPLHFKEFLDKVMALAGTPSDTRLDISGMAR